MRLIEYEGLSWSWSHGSWIYNYLCNQCLSPLKLWAMRLFEHEGPSWSHGRLIYNYLCNQCLSPLKLWAVRLFEYEGLSWSWSHGRLIYNYLCKQCPSLLKLWVQTLDKICQWLATGRWFSPVSSTNKTLNTINHIE